LVCPYCNTSNPTQAKYCLNCATPLRGDTPIKGLTGRLLPNTVLANRYLIVRKLGRGGMGAVYLVSDMRLGGKNWAIKEMSQAALVDEQERKDALAAFQREANLLATLNHPNLTKVVDYFEEGGKHYLVMDYIDGQTLDELIEARTEPFSEAQVNTWALQLCDVLQYLHTLPQPVIFRDLKPGNVMITKDGQAKLIDFGIARLFKPGKNRDTASFGTAGYSPPEQYGRGQTDARSDVYSLGATLHQMITLRDPQDEPFRFQNPKITNQLISNRFDHAIMKAVQQDPENRWQSAHDFSQAIQEDVPTRIPHTQPTLQAQTPLSASTQPTIQQVAKTFPFAKPISKKTMIKISYIAGGGVVILLIIALVTLIVTNLISISPKGSFVFTSNRDGKMEIYKLDDSGNPIRITHTSGKAESWAPVRMPDGRIVFTSNRDGKREIYRLEKSGETVRLTNTPGDSESWSPAISPSGKILFVSNQDGKREIYRFDEKEGITRVTHTPGDAESWSPSITSQNRLIYVSNRSGKREIYRIDKSGNPVKITNTPGQAESWSPSLSPNNKTVFVSNRDGKPEIYFINKSGIPVQLTHSPGNTSSWSPTLSPGGKLLFTSDRNGEPEIFILDDSGHPSQVTNTPGTGASWTSSDE